MKITILGSGTSTGVPEYKCDCDTCEDARIFGSKNRRTRASIHIEDNGHHLQFDVGPNFIDQIDGNKIPWIDAVLFTHCHADHISGVNDLVMPCRKQKMDMPIYGSDEVMNILQRNNDYMFDKNRFQGGGIGHLIPHSINSNFELCGFDITPIHIEHGAVITFGYRVNSAAYIPDVKRIPEASKALLHDLDVLILDSLSFNPKHPTHLSVDEAVDIVNELNPKQAYFTHIMHRLDHRYFREQCEEQDIIVPSNVSLAYDGQIIEI
ncbi:MAG: MBL fold metallo-hydrolase [Candidatus Poribacteria bacterium]